MRFYKVLFGMMVFLGIVMMIGSIGGCDNNSISIGKCLIVIIVGLNFCIVGSFGLTAEKYIHNNNLKNKKRYNDNLKATIAYLNNK